MVHLWDRAYVYRDSVAVEKYVRAAIISAREVYQDPQWLFWAANWLSGRDRSYESAQLVRRACRKTWADQLAYATGQGIAGACDKPMETLSDELPAERAAWAAGLALIAAPMCPSLKGAFLRFEAAVKHQLPRLLAVRAAPGRLPLRMRWMWLGRRLGALLAPSEVLAAGTVQS